MQHEIDHVSIRLLALRQPVAIDLREVLSAQRIANELERICELRRGRCRALPRAPHEWRGASPAALPCDGRGCIARLALRLSPALTLINQGGRKRVYADWMLTLKTCQAAMRANPSGLADPCQQERP